MVRIIILEYRHQLRSLQRKEISDVLSHDDLDVAKTPGSADLDIERIQVVEHLLATIRSIPMQVLGRSNDIRKPMGNVAKRSS